jgi:hypothetical protein
MSNPGDFPHDGREMLALPEAVLDGIEQPWRDVLTPLAPGYLAEVDAANGELPPHRQDEWNQYLGIFPSHLLYMIFHTNQPAVREMLLTHPTNRWFTEGLQQVDPRLFGAYQVAARMNEEVWLERSE